MTYDIIFEANPKSDDVQHLNDKIIEEHKKKRTLEPLTFFGFFIRDSEGEILAGCAGNTMYGSLFIGNLWVSEPLRGKGIGTQLMQRAEQLAKERGCHFIALNTFDWEALDFYRKLGFTVELERHGFDNDSVFCFLRKNLDS